MIPSSNFRPFKLTILSIAALLTALFVFVPLPSNAASGDYPALGEQRVIDDAGMVSNQLARQMENTFQQVSQVHRLDMYLVTLRDTGLMDPQTYLKGLVRNWRLLGRSQSRDYLVFMLMPGEGQWFVDGKGKQADLVLPIAQNSIWDEVVHPRMQAGQFDEALRLGLNAVLREVNSLDWQQNKPVGAAAWAGQPALLVAKVQSGLKQAAVVLFALGLWGYLVGGSWQIIMASGLGGLRQRLRGRKRSLMQQRAWVQWPVARSETAANAGPVVKPIKGGFGAYGAFLQGLWQELGRGDGRYEAKYYKDVEGRLRFLYRPLTLRALVAVPADMAVLVLAGLALTHSWAWLMAQPIYIALPCVGLSLVAGLGAVRFLACLLLPFAPLGLVEVLVALQAQAQGLRRQTAQRRYGGQAWANVALVPSLGLGYVVLLSDREQPARAGVVDALAKTYSQDLAQQNLTTGLRALIYGLEKHMAWSRLRRGDGGDWSASAARPGLMVKAGLTSRS